MTIPFHFLSSYIEIGEDVYEPSLQMNERIVNRPDASWVGELLIDAFLCSWGGWLYEDQLYRSFNTNITTARTHNNLYLYLIHNTI